MKLDRWCYILLIYFPLSSYHFVSQAQCFSRLSQLAQHFSRLSQLAQRFCCLSQLVQHFSCLSQLAQCFSCLSQFHFPPDWLWYHLKLKKSRSKYILSSSFPPVIQRSSEEGSQLQSQSHRLHGWSFTRIGGLLDHNCCHSQRARIVTNLAV